MLLKILLCFLCGIRGLGAQESQPHEDPPTLLLVSFDGFRADYMQRFPMPNLKLLYSQGVLVEELTNVFVTKTFPNHYSLMTGLYAESHGILASKMYDDSTNKSFVAGLSNDLMWWDKVRPLWLQARDFGYKTATVMWPGSEVPNRTATHFFPYNFDMPFKQRLGNLTDLMLGKGEEERVQFAALYWEEPDHSGHIFGPDNDMEMGKVLKEVDDNIGLLMSELKRTGLWGRINLIVTSDHGMAQCSPERLIRLDDCLHPDNYTVVDLSPVSAIRPRADPETVFNLLKKCHPRMKAYMKESIPDRFHYRNNKRIQPIILIADEGWIIVQRGGLPRLGEHGYDNSLPSMHPFLTATGPSFRQGHRMKSMQSVDVYPLMCHLLSIPPQPNNGTLNQARELLTSQPWDVSLMIGLVVGVLMVLTLFTAVFVLLGSRRRRRSGPQPFQRLQLDEDDDDPLLE